MVRDSIANLEAMQALYDETNRLLHDSDPGFPLIPFAVDRLRHDQFGARYAVFTEAGMAARTLLAEREGLALEGTYTAKAMAALLADIDDDRLAGQNVVYWHTYNSIGLADRVDGLDYRVLPADFHRYFEQPVQPLDA